MAGLPAPLRFSTRDVPDSARTRAVRTLRERGLLPIEPLPEAVPTVDLVKWQLPGASLLTARFADVRQIGSPHAAGACGMFFGINLSGLGVARQHGSERLIRGGDAVAFDSDDGPFTVLRPGASRMIGVRLPGRAVAPDTGRREPPGPRLIAAPTPALRLLASYLRSLLRDPVPTAALADAVVDHITTLIALSLGATAVAAPEARGSLRAARLRAVEADIGRHLTDPDLTPAAVAARHGISVRYLHRLFEAAGTTYSRFVLDQRLDLVHQRLRNPRFAGHTITTIAADAGFTDPSYFNRTFRRRYGTTPTDVRHAATAVTSTLVVAVRRRPR